MVNVKVLKHPMLYIGCAQKEIFLFTNTWDQLSYSNDNAKKVDRFLYVCFVLSADNCRLLKCESIRTMLWRAISIKFWSGNAKIAHQSY